MYLTKILSFDRQHILPLVKGCCVTVSSKMKHFLLQERSFSRKIKTQNSFRSLWKLPDSVGPAPWWYKQQKLKVSCLKQAKLQRFWDQTSCWGKAETSWADWKRFTESYLDWTLSNLLSYLQAVQSAPGSQLCELSWGWALVIQLFLNHNCSCKWHLTYTPGTTIKLTASPSWILVVSVVWSVVGSLSGGSRQMCGFSPEKVCHVIPSHPNSIKQKHTVTIRWKSTEKLTLDHWISSKH